MKVISGSHIYCPHSVAGSCCGQTIAPCMPTIMGKKQVKAMKAHTLRHFSIAGLMRDQNFQAACVQLEDIVVKKHRRRVDLLPQGVLTLHAVVEVLIDFSADHHKRKTASRNSTATRRLGAHITTATCWLSLGTTGVRARSQIVLAATAKMIVDRRTFV